MARSFEKVQRSHLKLHLCGVIGLIIGSSLILDTESMADTVSLKNGGSIEGIIEKEDVDSVVVDVGFGTVTIEKDKIDMVHRSASSEVYLIRQKWEEKRRELKSREKEFEEERERRFSEAYEDRLREAVEKKLKEPPEAKEIQAARDAMTKSIVVDVLLNGKVNATLVLDTGASLVVLSKKVGSKLGIDLSSTEKDMVQLQLAGNNSVKARTVILESVSIQDIEVKNVLAAVLIDDVQDIGFKDGLLGMSFLSQFNLKIDLKTMKITLEKLK